MTREESKILKQNLGHHFGFVKTFNAFLSTIRNCKQRWPFITKLIKVILHIRTGKYLKPLQVSSTVQFSLKLSTCNYAANFFDINVKILIFKICWASLTSCKKTCYILPKTQTNFLYQFFNWFLDPNCKKKKKTFPSVFSGTSNSSLTFGLIFH